MKRMFAALCCVLLIACGSSNPLIGKWEGSVDIANDTLKQSLSLLGVDTAMTVEFTPKEMIMRQGGKEVRKAVKYRVEGKQVYITEDTGKTEKTEVWEHIPVKDDNTIEFPVMTGITATLKRAK